MRTVHLTKAIRMAAGAAAMATLVAAAAPAEPQGVWLNELEVVVTDLGGGSNAQTFWVDRPDGFHVVTIVDTIRHDGDRGDGRDGHSAVQVTMMLWPGQTQLITVPGPNLPTLRIRRDGDRVELISSDCESRPAASASTPVAKHP
jgi:hypothetical protein